MKLAINFCQLIFVCVAIEGSLVAEPLKNMVSPVSNPVNFEDPRANTELRAIYLYHKISDDFVTQGGSVNIFALQARLALNDRLALIATKDGYVDLNADAVVDDASGFGNIAAGAKYAFYKDEAISSIGTGGLTYEIPTGDDDVFQDNKNGLIHPFLSGATQLGGLNIMSATGVRWALDDSSSSFFDFDLHVDKQLGSFYPGLELNLVNVLNEGDRLAIPDEGADYFNFGASDSEGNTVVTGAVVGRYKFSDRLTGGLAYQFPLTDGDGSNLFDWRITTDLIISF